MLIVTVIAYPRVAAQMATHMITVRQIEITPSNSMPAWKSVMIFPAH